jgi:hypothetical protein
MSGEAKPDVRGDLESSLDQIMEQDREILEALAGTDTGRDSQMKVARRVMRTRREALRRLADS